ncbi:hypothetical protein [Paenibacillus sp. FSL M7-0134]|uniref:hypothetical protein n=1 Tax=Paenibacillus sp. FSL M7-0134 TaxID=2954754 RepID=UPI0030F6F0CA
MDLDKYENFDSNPACETYGKLAENIEKYNHFTILEGETTIGALDIGGNDDRMHIDNVCVSPLNQNKGAGTGRRTFASLTRP